MKSDQIHKQPNCTVFFILGLGYDFCDGFDIFSSKLELKLLHFLSGEFNCWLDSVFHNKENNVRFLDWNWIYHHNLLIIYFHREWKYFSANLKNLFWHCEAYSVSSISNILSFLWDISMQTLFKLSLNIHEMK